MKDSNLAECFEEFEVVTKSLTSAPDRQEPDASQISVTPAANTPMLAPRRRTLGTRRIQINDQGLRPFRVL